MDTKFLKYDQNPENYKDRGETNLMKIEHYPEMDTFGKQDPQPNLNKILESDLAEVKNKVSIKKNPSVKNRGASFAEGNPKRITLITTDKEGNSRMTQKLRPTLIGNDYYY